MAEMRQKKRHSKSHTISSVSVKCVILGDGNVGKSAMLLTYLTGKFPDPDGLSPGPIDGLSEFSHVVSKPVTITHENTEINVTFVDTYGQDEYDKLRERTCTQADVYIVCYDVNCRATFERVEHQWLPELAKYSAPNTPFLIAGLKTDVRTKALVDGSDLSNTVTFTDGKAKADSLGAAFYVECTAQNNYAGVKAVFDKAARAAALNSLPEDLKRGSCVVS